MNITVKIQNVYGKETIYPACEVSRDLLALTGKKTFSARDIKTIKRLGYLVGVATPTLGQVTQTQAIQFYKNFFSMTVIGTVWD